MQPLLSQPFSCSSRQYAIVKQERAETSRERAFSGLVFRNRLFSRDKFCSDQASRGQASHSRHMKQCPFNLLASFSHVRRRALLWCRFGDAG